MNDLHEIFEQIQRDLTCPSCGQNFELGEIRLKGLIDNTLMVQTICSNGHIAVYMSRYGQAKTNLITAEEINKLHKYLKNFDGDFQQLLAG